MSRVSTGEPSENAMIIGATRNIATGRLDLSEHMRHNYRYDGRSFIPARCQSRRVARAGHVASASRDGARPAVWLARVFRSARCRAGEIRNAPAGRRGWPPNHGYGRGLRLLAPDVLPRPGGV